MAKCSKCNAVLELHNNGFKCWACSEWVIVLDVNGDYRYELNIHPTYKGGNDD